MNKRITESFYKRESIYSVYYLRGSVTGGDRAACICHGGGRGRSDRAGNPVF